MDVMTENKVVPKLRFKLKGEKWFYKKIGDICIVKTGSKDTQDRKESGKYPFFVRSNTVEKIDSFSFDGEAILTSGDGVGVGKNFHYINDKFDYHQRVYALHTFKEGFSGKFIFQVFKQKFYRRVMRLSAKNSVDSVRMSMITDMEIAFPSLPEQQKIASFLSAVDEKLQQLTKKAALLETYKKGVLQKIFSQELRFKDEFGNKYPDWEEKKLGEELEHKSIRNKSNQVDLVLSVSNKKGFISQQEQFDGHQVASKDVTNYKVVNKGEYAYNPSRINVGSIARLDDFEKGIVSPMYVIFRLKNNLNPIFFDALYSLHRFKYLIKIGCSGSVRDSLNFDEMEKFDIKLPCLNEQQKIANFLSSLDSKIALVSSQIENTKSFKKGLLQQMFV